MSFVKIHGTILDSSVWAEPHATRIVWLTMLAMADQDGVVGASVGGLARRAVVSREECETALATFLGPDEDSRDGTTGERVEAVPGGWLILNHAEYRDRRTRAQIQTADRVRRHRKRVRDGVTRNDVTVDNARSLPEAEADTDTEAELDGARSSRSRVNFAELFGHFEGLRTTAIGGRVRGLTDARRAMLRKLHAHIRSDMSCDVEQATAHLLRYLEWRVEDAKTNADSRKYITKAAPFRVSSWDFYRELEDRKDAKRVSDDYEQRREQEKAREVKAWGDSAAKNLFG